MSSREQGISDRDVLAAFQGTIERPRTSLTYKAGLLVVAMAMVLLPVVYLALVAGIGLATWWHAVHDTAILGHRANMWTALAYGGPIFAGCAAIAFLLKPFFAKPDAGAEPVIVTRKEEPLLFTYVDRIADLAGAPRPHRIELDCDVNASARLDGGFAGLFGRRLVLRIGLPLVTGMQLRNLTGVLAHELGHFGQGAGMRLTFMVRSMNAWLARIAFTRDSWDEALASQGGHLIIVIAVQMARLLVWTSRKVLAAFAFMGHAISCFMLRQMEFDADRYEARVCGSEQYASTARRLHQLGAASAMAHGRLGELWRARRLADDLPALIAGQAASLPAEVVRKVDASVREGRTGWFDTHPCDRERIDRAKAERTAGIFALDAPATVLFKDLPRACRQASLAYYREQLGSQVGAQNLVGTGGLVERQREESELAGAASRFWQDALLPGRPIGLGAVLPSPDPAALRQARAAAEAALKEAGPALARWRKSEELEHDAVRADVLLAARLSPSAAGLSLPRPGAEGVQALTGRASAFRAESEPALLKVEEAQRARLLASLALLQHPQMGERIAEAEALAASVRAWLATLSAVEAALPDVAEIRRASIALVTLLKEVPPSGELTQEHRDAVMARTRGLHVLLHDLRPRLRMAHPFPPGGEPASVADFAVSELPPPDQPVAVYRAADAALQSLHGLHHGLLSRVCAAAERAESAVGLEPMRPTGQGT